MDLNKNSKEAFKIPTGYFDEKKNNLKHIAIAKPKGKVIWLKPILVLTAIAATLALLYISILPAQNQIDFNSVSDDVLVAYLSHETESQPMLLVANTAINAFEISDFNMEGSILIEEHQLEDYLLEENDNLIFEDLF